MSVTGGKLAYGVSDFRVDECRTSYPIDTIDALLQGNLQLYSFPGTSQYSQGSPSGCGFAALNCARTILGWENHEYMSARSILERLCHKGTMEVCSHSSRSYSKDSDDRPTKRILFRFVRLG